MLKLIATNNISNSLNENLTRLNTIGKTTKNNNINIITRNFSSNNDSADNTSQIDESDSSHTIDEMIVNQTPEESLVQADDFIDEVMGQGGISNPISPITMKIDSSTNQTFPSDIESSVYSNVQRGDQFGGGIDNSLLVGRPDDLELVRQSNDNLEYSKLRFEAAKIANGINEGFSSNHDQLKHAGDREFHVSNSPFLTFGMQSQIRDFTKKYIPMTLSGKLEPISSQILYNLGGLMLNNDLIIGSPLYQGFRGNMTFVTSVIYGWSIGSPDLIRFLKRSFNTLQLTFKHSTRVNEVHSNEMIVKLINEIPEDVSEIQKRRIPEPVTYKGDGFSPVMDVKSASGVRSRNDHMTGHHRSTAIQSYKEMFEFSVDYRISTSSEGVSSDTTSHIRESNSDGSITSGSISFSRNGVSSSKINPKILLNANHIIDALIALFQLNEFYSKSDDVDANMIINYVCNLIYSWIVSNVSLSASDKLVSVDFDLTINDKMGSNTCGMVNGHNIFKDYVNSGKFMPVSWLHFDYFLNESTIDKFKWEIFLASIGNPIYNYTINGPMPTVLTTSKNEFMHVMRNSSRRNSNTVKPCSNDWISKIYPNNISRLSVIMELYVRSILRDNTPKGLGMYTKSGWSDNTMKGNDIHIATSPNVLSSYSINDYENVVGKIIDILLLKKFDNKMYKRRYGLFKELPEGPFDRMFRLEDSCDLGSSIDNEDEFSMDDSDSNENPTL